ncbi:MAG: hypothetical protein HC837_17355 [Chloroflexaceae bacterium]|nr:hypothetical protein [Chloroflexaceae bacterium]
MSFRSVAYLIILTLFAVNISLIPTQAAPGSSTPVAAAVPTVDITKQMSQALVRAAVVSPAADQDDIELHQAAGGIRLTRIGRYDTGIVDDAAAEIVAHDPASQRLFVVNSSETAPGIDILDVSDPTSPTLVSTIDTLTLLPGYGGAPNSVALYPYPDGSVLAVAMESTDDNVSDSVVFLDTDGNALSGVPTYPGSLPDMVTFTPDGSKALVANEGEPNELENPEGSVGVIDMTDGAANLTNDDITIVGFTDFNAGGPRADEITNANPPIRIFGTDATVAQDLEPEYIATTADSTTAYVSIQENNALAVVDLETLTITSLVGLGFKDYNVAGNDIDASDEDGAINITTWPALGMYQPDSIATFEVGGNTYVLSANEGDARDFEEARVEDLTLDSSIFPDAATLQLPENLGRLEVTNTLGDPDNDGEYEALYSYGARSFSIWNASGELVYDSGDDLEQRTASFFATECQGSPPPDSCPFNSNGPGTDSFDSRSDAKGPEPEAATTGVIDGQTYAFIGLERTGGIMVYDVINPNIPAFIEYVNDGDDLAPEGIIFIPASRSPNGNPLLVVANEVSGSTSIYQIDEPQPTATTLTLLHNNDGESSLQTTTNIVNDVNLPVGGVAAFKTLTDQQIAQARGQGNAVMNVYAGDAILPGASLLCSLEGDDPPVYDALAQREIPYTAHIFGNHEFDNTPDFLERFIRTFDTNNDGNPDQPFISGNLDFSNEPGFADLIDPNGVIESNGDVVSVISNGQVVGTALIYTDNQTDEQFGIVAATTWDLPNISSPRDVAVTTENLTETATLVQQQINDLQGRGIDKIIFVSHLQNLTNDVDLIQLVSGVDIAVGGGGDDLLLNPNIPDNQQLLPGEAELPSETFSYPTQVTGADNNPVYLVTAKGGYQYLGRLDVAFDANGVVTGIISEQSYPRPVIPTSDEADVLGLTNTVQEDQGLLDTVIAPLEACLAEFASEGVANSELLLNTNRSSVRTGESNFGNIVADSYLSMYEQYAADNGLPPISAQVVAVQNGGGIRQPPDQLPEGGAPGKITRQNTLDVMRFLTNEVTVIEDVTPEDVKHIFERSASGLPNDEGQFLQIAGLTVIYDLSKPAQEIAVDGKVTAEGSRVVSVMLNDGTMIVEDGEVVAGAPNLAVVTNSFTAAGGDNYIWFKNNTNQTNFRNSEGKRLNYEEAVVEYLRSFATKEVNGETLPTVPATDRRYQPGGEGRSLLVVKSLIDLENGTTLTSDRLSGGISVTVSISPGTTISPTGILSPSLQISPVPSTTVTAPPANALGLYYGINILDNTNNTVDNPTFDPPLTIVVDYLDSDVAGFDETTLNVVFLDSDGNWISDGVVLVERDTVNNRLTYQVNHLTEFGLIGNPTLQGSGTIYLPLIWQGATSPANTAVTRLTLLHNNDGESSLQTTTNTVDDVDLPVGGVAAFKTLTDQQIAAARDAGNAVVNVYAGDAILPGASLLCSVEGDDPPVYDALAQREIAYTAHIFGNHEFDNTPDFLERFIRTFDEDGDDLPDQPFLSGNLDFSAEAGFADMIDADGIVFNPVTDGRVVGQSMIYSDTTTGETFGIVAATTWNLPTISSPRDVAVTTKTLEETAALVQQLVDALYNDYGVRKIIFVSHLQNLDNDVELIQLLTKVDIAVGGGGDELLLNSDLSSDMQLLPGEAEESSQYTYPTAVTGADGNTVYLVTTKGGYQYLGHLDVGFNANGDIVDIDSSSSYPRRVIPTSDAATQLSLADAVASDVDIETNVIAPLETCLEGFATDAVAASEVLFDTSRSSVRGGESNFGNLVADGYRYLYEQYAADNGLPAITNQVVAVQNGGGIRQPPDQLPEGGAPGTITRQNTLDVMRFLTNEITVIDDVTPADLKAIFERSAASLPDAGGQFLQVSGLNVTYDISQPAQEIDVDGDVAVDGSRVVSVALTDGTAIIENGEVVAGAPNLTIITNSFTAAGGDNYIWFASNTNQTALRGPNGKFTYEDAVVEYLRSFPVSGDLPTVPADDARYQPGGEGRITINGG